MKKYFSIICLSLAISPWLMAQDGNSVLPQKGDWAVSINAAPVLQYIGQLFNGTNGNAVINRFGGQPYLNNDVTTGNFGVINPLVSVSAKYLLTDDIALRLNAGWLYTYDDDKFYVQDDAARLENPISTKRLIDTRIVRGNGVSLMFGAERRVGKKNIQGVFGGGVLYANQVGSRKFMYGNIMNQDNQSPSIAVGGATVPAGFSSARVLESRIANSLSYLGAVAFVGVEWFVSSKISLGGEVNIAAVYRFGGNTYTTIEGYNTLSMQVEEWTDLTAPTSSGFSFGTGNIGGNLSLNFYF